VWILEPARGMEFMQLREGASVQERKDALLYTEFMSLIWIMGCGVADLCKIFCCSAGESHDWVCEMSVKNICSGKMLMLVIVWMTSSRKNSKIGGLGVVLLQMRRVRCWYGNWEGERSIVMKDHRTAGAEISKIKRIRGQGTVFYLLLSRS
jgi:hypothetical protein